MVLLIIATVIIALILMGTILHATYYKSKKNNVQPYGEMIDVFDGKMHLYKMGNKDKTVVLLPGLGTALPCADFGPFMRSLSKDYTVVCVDYFGVGFSTETTRQRTCENYVEEIRAALSKAGFHAPYVLIPHSISSVYSEYYAAKYPNEVEAIISLDGTSTAYVGEDMPGFVKKILGVAKIQQTIGLISVIAPLSVKRTDSLQCGYTEKEINDMVTFSGFSFNNTLLEQLRNSAEFVKCVHNTTYPTQVPYFKVISKQTYETPNKQIKMSPKEYQMEHLVRVGAEHSYEILDGTHFIYQKNADRIKDIVTTFLSSR